MPIFDVMAGLVQVDFKIIQDDHKTMLIQHINQITEPLVLR